ncbi:MAG: hypothetical protein M3O28_13930 [Actinomycetota bacterium]|nr:hypothetical protein [Actinomycetota bacterium]
MPAQTERPRLHLSATQLIASALAAVTATIAASYLGVSGTVIGAAVASVLTVIGNAVYSHSIRSTSDRVRTVVPVPVRRFAGVPAASPTDATTTLARVQSVPPALGARTTWRRVGITAFGVFAALLTVLTSVELVSGRPLADLLRGKPAAGTTVFGSSQSSLGRASGSQPAPQVTVTQTVVPKVVTVTPTVTRTAPVRTVTPATSAAPSASAPVTSSPTPTPTPSGTSPTP